MTTKSPSSAAAPSAVSRRALRSRSASSSASTAASSAPASRLPTSTPLYSPSVAVGRTPISMVKVSGWPSPGRSPTSSSGSPTGWMPAASIASRYQRPIAPRTVSSSTLSRPMRWITTGGGTLPLRKPGIRRFWPSCRAVACMRRSISAAGTSASTRTRDSGSSVTDVLTAAGMGA